jgi:diguanylate cyclase (GGDEF)-like protein/PAS domain S-box-containing protein
LPYSSTRPSNPYAAAATVALIVVAMTAFVFGLVVWKALGARKDALALGERDIRNLSHSLSEHASRSIQAADIAMTGIASLLKYRRPDNDRLNQFLRETIKALPQIREMGVLDTGGEWIYSSLDEVPRSNNADRGYFIYHRDNPDTGLRISEPLRTRVTAHRSIILSKRISDLDGNFAGVLIAAIDRTFFDNFYGAFHLGPHAAIALMRGDGALLARWPETVGTRDLSTAEFFKTDIEHRTDGSFRARSPFDGHLKYFGFEQATQYPVICIVAETEDELLAGWREDLRHDATVAALLMSCVILLAALLTAQFRARLRIERELRDKEGRYRLLADNIADVVVLIDGDGIFRYVSPSVEPVLGYKPHELIGHHCYEYVHRADLDGVRQIASELIDWTMTKTMLFRTARANGALSWVEINLKLAGTEIEHGQYEVVGILRDVTTRVLMEDELNALNAQLAQLATTDGLTGLANRRTFDTALRREFGHRPRISAIMLDIDSFKNLNDALGHQAGDRCLQGVARVIADTIGDGPALAARYGGEEFGIILPDHDELEALKVAESIRYGVLALGIENPGAGCMSVSLGVAGRAIGMVSETQLVGVADRALYEAKRQGRNCAVPASSLRHEDIVSPPLADAGEHHPDTSREAAQ